MGLIFYFLRVFKRLNCFVFHAETTEIAEVIVIMGHGAHDCRQETLMLLLETRGSELGAVLRPKAMHTGSKLQTDHSLLSSCVNNCDLC